MNVLQASRIQKDHVLMGCWISLAFFTFTFTYFSGLNKLLPSFISCAAASFMLSLGPGFSLFSIFSFFQKHKYDKFSIFLVSISMGMTSNFILNVAVFLIRPDIRSALNAYIFVVVFLYVVILYRWSSQGLLKIQSRRTLLTPQRLVILFAGLLFCFALFLRYHTVLFSEELMVVRKISDNLSIGHDNISFRRGEVATYFFVPLYIFISMVGEVAGIDAYAAIPALWPFTALISILCLIKISHLVTGRWGAGLALAAMALMHAVLLRSERADMFTVFVPYPDRYAFSSALLVPLAVFHFLIHLKHKEINVPTFIGLVYLIVEMTFIHARETIFTVVIIGAVCCVLALNYNANRKHLLRILWVVVLIALCLMAYKMVNFIVQPFLKEFVFGHRQAMVIALKELWSNGGVLAFFSDISFYPVLNYNRFILIYLGGAGFYYIPIAVMLLPFYVLCSKRISMLYIPFAICLFGLYAIWGGVRLALGVVVGVPFVFDCYSMLGILLTIVFADMLRLIVSAFLKIDKILPLVTALALFVVAVYFVCSKFIVHFYEWHMYVARLDMALYVATLFAIVYQQQRINRSFSSTASIVSQEHTLRSRPAMFNFVTVLLALFFSAIKPLSGGIGALPSPYFRVPIYSEASSAVSTIISSYPVNADLPARNIALIDFIRKVVPPGSNWFGTDTITPLLAANQFSPVILVNGFFREGYEINHPFIRRWMPSHNPQLHTSIFDLLSTLPPDGLEKLLSEYSVDWLFIDNKLHSRFQEIVCSSLSLSKELTLEYFDSDAYIYRVGFGPRKLPSNFAE